MAASTGIAVVAVDPAYTSRWGAQHWLAPIRQHHPELTGHHAAALVIADADSAFGLAACVREPDRTRGCGCARKG